MRQLALAAVLFLALEACEGPARTATPSSTPTRASAAQKIKHVIVVMQENRSFDQYFGLYPGAAGLPRQNGKFTLCVPDPAHGGCVAPYHDTKDRSGGGPHFSFDATADINNGKMDGFI